LGAGSRASKREEKERKKQLKKSKKKGGKKRAMEQFEMDLESQSSDLGKGAEKDKVPGVLRALVGLITVTFKCLVWCATVAFKTLVAILSVLTRCCGMGKL
jgi:Flp pilus assembly protein TadB